jgi:pimeloyl-ACP methyl ester carboxylesterase
MPDPGPRERSIDANGLKHHVLEWDHSASDITVVLLHGFLDLAWSFAHVAARLARSYHVVAPDFRGHGDTQWVGAGGYYYFPDYILDLTRVLPQITRARTYIVGHSMGGTVATYYTGLFPHRVQKLALLEGIGPPGDDPAIAPERVLEHLRTVDNLRSRKPRILQSLDEAVETLTHIYPRVDRQVLREYARCATRPSPDAPVGSLRWKYDPLHRTRSPLPFDERMFAAFIRRIECPVLLVDSADRVNAGLTNYPRQALYTTAVQRVLVDSGHMMQLDQPQALAEMVMEFLADQGAPVPVRST